MFRRNYDETPLYDVLSMDGIRISVSKIGKLIEHNKWYMSVCTYPFYFPEIPKQNLHFSKAESSDSAQGGNLLKHV